MDRSIKPYIRKFWHFVLRTLKSVSRTSSPVLPLNPKRILLLNGAHIGDIVISTALLPVLRSAYPEAEIGFATARWSQAIVRNNPLISYHHRIDHSKLNREDSSWFARQLRYWRTRRQALKEIRRLSYDISISLYPWRPDFLFLVWQAKIPIRVAFSRTLWAPLATHLAEYPEQNPLLSQGLCQIELLRSIGIGDHHLKLRRSSLAPSDEQSIQEICTLLGVQTLESVQFSIVHMGAGTQTRELPISFWREFATMHTVPLLVFTGKGRREAENIEQAISGLPHCVNACDKLSWNGFVAAMRHADILFGVESMAVHVAAAVGTPCTAVYSGIGGPSRWRPEGKHCTVWTNAVPCSPCGRYYGCADMTCMKSFTPQHLLALLPQK